MSQFHSTVSRRDFMKALGLTAAGAAALTTPVYHDLDEAVSSTKAEWKRPWWVKSREHENPTVELDWSMMYRSDGKWTGQDAGVQTLYLGADEVKRRADVSAKFSADGLKAGTPGLSLRDVAVSSSNVQASALVTFMGPKVTTPEQRGVPKWTGTPEENARMIRAAAVFCGAAQVGMEEISSRVKEKLIRAKDKATQNKKYIFEDVQVGYEGTDKLVFPDKVQLYDFAMTVPMSEEMFRTSPASNLQGAANSSRYSRFSLIAPRIQSFVGTLGYNCYGYTGVYNGAIPTIAAASLQGLGEGGRNNGVFISPEYGPTVGLFSLITDLPIESTAPVDAGIHRFCHTCSKCADTCPTGSISKDKEPSWEVPKIFGKEDTTHIPGRKEWWTNGVDCWTGKNTVGGCANCMATCVFNTGSGAIHQYVRAALATTGVFNSFFAQMDVTFGYGLREGDDKSNWWHLAQPTYGFDSSLVAYDKTF
ncbi:MAG: reductive dehalogenase [Dehalogenimonas sp.]